MTDIRRMLEHAPPKRTLPSVVTEQAEGPPVDLDAWAERYVALLLRLDAEERGGASADERRIGA